MVMVWVRVHIRRKMLGSGMMTRGLIQSVYIFIQTDVRRCVGQLHPQETIDNLSYLYL